MAPPTLDHLRKLADNFLLDRHLTTIANEYAMDDETARAFEAYARETFHSPAPSQDAPIEPEIGPTPSKVWSLPSDLKERAWHVLAATAALQTLEQEPRSGLVYDLMAHAGFDLRLASSYRASTITVSLHALHERDLVTLEQNPRRARLTAGGEQRLRDIPDLRDHYERAARSLLEEAKGA